MFVSVLRSQDALINTNDDYQSMYAFSFEKEKVTLTVFKFNFNFIRNIQQFK